MNYLSKENIVSINQFTISKHGGNFNPPSNYLHEENLDYLIDIVSSEMFGHPIYPTLASKASLYMYNIIANHVFSDGNKRTGLEAAIVFLRINGKNISTRLSDDDIFNFTIKVASGNCSLEDTQKWFEDNVVNEYLS